LVFILITLPVSSQNSSVEVQHSTDKVLINGKVYFIHIVKKGETLYSIAKAYHVMVADITTVNPNAVVEIKPEQVLRIPELAAHTEEIHTNKNGDQIIHVVAQGQTLYTISKIYGVTVQEILNLNPGIKTDSLKINQEIKIPLPQKTESNIKIQENNEGFLLHIVENKETLYSLSKKYEVSQEEILQVNETVAKEGLKAGEEIRIPVAGKQKNFVIADTSVNEKKTITATISKIDCDTIAIKFKEKTISISLLLPLFSSGAIENVSETSEENQNDEKIQTKQNEDFNPIAMNFIEFYQGILLSLEEFKNNGFKINLNVFDTEKGTSKLNAIIENKEFQQSNIIIGPAFPDQMKIVAEFARKNSIYIISPVSCHEDFLKDNPYLFQVNTGIDRELKADMELLKPDTSKNILLVYNSNSIETDQYKNNKELSKNVLKVNNSKVKEITVYANDFTDMKSEIDSLRDNLVFSPETDEIFITNMLSVLESTLVENKVYVIGMMEWANFKGIDLNYFYDMQLKYHTPFYVDYEKENIKKFLKKYRIYFNTEPVKSSKYGFNYSMLGYDIASYFTEAYTKYGQDFSRYLPCLKYNSLVAPFNFIEESPGSGFANTYLQLVRYNKDYSIERTYPHN